MKRSLLKYSAWISLVCLLCFSCSSSRIFVSGDEAGKIRESFLDSSFEKITCKTRVTFHENELSGLMLIKKTEEGNYKLAFYNELGMTYLEGLFVNTGKHPELVVNRIIPVLDHKTFIKSFEKSLETVFSDKVNPRIPSSPPPGHHASSDGSTLKIELHNGFLLEVSPQVNTE